LGSPRAAGRPLPARTSVPAVEAVSPPGCQPRYAVEQSLKKRLGEQTVKGLTAEPLARHCRNHAAAAKTALAPARQPLGELMDDLPEAPGGAAERLHHVIEDGGRNRVPAATCLMRRSDGRAII